ncbi:MAG: extracellular solute-binding protein [Elusimicrobiota bacterium]|jgi:multiple sugar transport system substrate-binding protein|nr:extracellular solute-binding protein [Elusimicrobiota bacterium]
MILWMMPDNATHTQDIMDNLLAPFRAENPDIDVQIKIINRRNLWTRIFTLKHKVGHDSCPDLIAMPNYWTELLIKADVLENLTELDKTLRVDNCLDLLKPSSYKKDTADIYSFPWWMDISALHFREDHLKLITDDAETMLSTWGGLLEACRLLKEHFSGSEEGYYPMQNNDWRGSLSHRSVLPCLWSRGAYILSPDGKTCGLDKPEFEQGMADFIELALKGYMPILKERSSLGLISSNKSTFMMTRRQGLTMFEGNQKSIKFKTLPVPRTGDNYANYMGGVNLAIVKGGTQRENALKLLKWLTQPDTQIEYAAKTEAFPAMESSFDNFLMASPQRLQNYTGIIASASLLPNFVITGTIMEMLANIMSVIASSILMHKYDRKILKDELQNAAKEIDNILRFYID